MDFTCNKSILVDAINKVQRAVPLKTTKPILMGILITVDDEKITFTANNLNLIILTEVSGIILKKGTIVVDAKLFGDIIRKFPEDNIRIKSDKDLNITISCKNIKFNLVGNDGEAFPSVPALGEGTTLVTKQYLIRDMINQTIFSIGDDDQKPYLSGIYMICSKGAITLVSVDGFRLALRKGKCDDSEIFMDAIIPGDSLSEISKILSEDDEDLLICVDENMIEFSTENTRIVSKLIEGEYLKYKAFIPEEFSCEVIVNTRELRNCIDRATLVVHLEKIRQPVLFKIKEDLLTVNANTATGTSMIREEIAIKSDGCDMEIKFNPRYFLDVLRVIDEEEIKIEFTSEIGPCVIKNMENDNYLYLILPLRKG